MESTNSDWAADAHMFYHMYHRKISFTCKNDDNNFQYNVMNDTDIFPTQFSTSSNFKVIHEKFKQHPLLNSINLSNFQSNPFEVLENVRGWQPFLKRMVTKDTTKIMTLLRRDITKPLQDQTNLCIVPRDKWMLIEALRWSDGLYGLKKSQDAINQNFQTDSKQNLKKNDGNDNRNNKRKNHAKREDILINSNTTVNGGGRYVTWNGQENLEPGDILLQVEPCVIATYDFAGTKACFHCGKEIIKQSNQIQNLYLQCVTCNIKYCSAECKKQNTRKHNQECQYIKPLYEKCLKDYENKIDPFKALIVLRVALLSMDETKKEELKKLKELEFHINDHQKEQPEYYKASTEMGDWIYNLVLGNSDINDTSNSTNSQNMIDPIFLRNMFFAININGFALGKYGCGLFPGLASMFNHSCNENIAHNFEQDNTRNNSGKHVMVFRALDTIKPGTECCFSYSNLLDQPTKIRTESLRKFKFFTCQCNRCKSETEESRLDAINEWKTCDNPYRWSELSSIIFPKYNLQKGGTFEKYGDALLLSLRDITNDNDNEGSNNIYQEEVKHLSDEDKLRKAKEMFEKARMQYIVCCGEESLLVNEINEKINRIILTEDTEKEIKETENAAPDVDHEDNTMNDDNYDIDMVNASKENHNVLFEIKPYEPLHVDALAKLALNIQSSSDIDSKIVSWNEDYRICPIGYGMLTLVLNCNFINNESIYEEDIAELIEDLWGDTVQRVDIFKNSREL